MAQIQTLPPEIFDTILDIVQELDDKARKDYWDDYSSSAAEPRKIILACALVCQSWLPRSRLHTFRYVYLSHFDRPACIAFGALVAHPLCTFRLAVESLNLEEGLERRSSEGFWLHEVLPSLALLPNVKDMSVSQAHFDKMSEGEWEGRVLPMFTSNLERLELQSNTFGRSNQVLEAVARCRNLQRLVLRWLDVLEAEDEHGYYHNSQPVSATTLPPPSPVLQGLTLEYGAAFSPSLLTWLCPGPRTSTVTRLTLDSISATTARHAARFLRDVGATVTELDLGFSDSSSCCTDGQDAFCEAMDLSTLHNLEILHFGCLAIYPVHSGREFSAKHVPRILDKLSASTPTTTLLKLKDIRFMLSMEEATDLEMLDWVRIIPTLNRAGFAQLERLSFGSLNEEAVKDCEAWLEENVRQELTRRDDVRIFCSRTYI